MYTRVPNIGPTQLLMLGNVVHPYIKQPGDHCLAEHDHIVQLYLPMGNNMEAPNVVYNLASGPILPTLRLENDP